MHRYTTLSIVIAAVLLIAACGSDATPRTTTPEIPAPQAATTASTVTTTQPPDAPEAFEILVEEDVVYHTDDGGSWTMDVLYPDAGGPWPLVVVYHGMTTNREVGAARQIAERGAVAVAPQWLKEVAPSFTREEYIDGKLFDRAACAVHAAQRIAPDYDADPANTTIAGFSAGIHPAGWIGLGVVRNDLCQAALTHLPVGVVLGDSQFIFYEDGWDASFGDPDSPAGDTLDRFVNPARWNVAEDLAVYLWISDYRHGRTIESPPSADSWILGRDTTGTLVDDLTSVGAFDDEWIGWMDNALLMERRLSAAGIDVVHEAVGGGHNYSTKVYDAIEAIVDAER